MNIGSDIGLFFYGNNGIFIHTLAGTEAITEAFNFSKINMQDNIKMYVDVLKLQLH